MLSVTMGNKTLKQQQQQQQKQWLGDTQRATKMIKWWNLYMDYFIQIVLNTCCGPGTLVGALEIAMKNIPPVLCLPCGRRESIAGGGQTISNKNNKKWIR